MSDLHWGLEFTHPGWLAAVVAVPWVVWYFRRSLVDFARWQRIVSTSVRVVIVLLLVLALAGLTLLRPTARQFVIVAVDHSLSVGEEPLPGDFDVNAGRGQETRAQRSAADRFLKTLDPIPVSERPAARFSPTQRIKLFEPLGGLNQAAKIREALKDGGDVNQSVAYARKMCADG